MVLIGYSGHAFVVADILHASGNAATYYCDKEEKHFNPWELCYLGNEREKPALEIMRKKGVFIAIGDNSIRAKIQTFLYNNKIIPANAIHSSAILSTMTKITSAGIMIAPGTVINPLVSMGDGVILNSGCIVEHECAIGSYSHIAPGAVLCGNVIVGQNTLIGAGAVVRQGLKIGDNVIVGAGAIVVKNIPDNTIVMGNPAI